MRYRIAGRYRPPPKLYRLMSSAVGMPAARRWSPANTGALEVPGRRSGRMRRTAVGLVDYEGRQFLVSLAGESQWVRNVRAAGGRVILRRGLSTAVHLVEVPPAN